MDDLISRATAIEAISSVEESYEREEDMDCAEAVMSARWAVQELKPVDAMPVIHGRWTTERTWKHDGEWYCSVCDYEPIVFMESNYCPSCGARMDGDAE